MSDLLVQTRNGETPLIAYLLRGDSPWRYLPDVLDVEGVRETINKQDSNGNTALMVAARKNNVEGVRALLAEPTIDPTIKNKQGKTALDIAREQAKGAEEDTLEALQGIIQDLEIHMVPAAAEKISSGLSLPVREHLYKPGGPMAKKVAERTEFGKGRKTFRRKTKKRNGGRRSSRRASAVDRRRR